MFQRFYDDGLAQSAYLIACARTRQAVVVDPRRDVAIYAGAARERDLDIVAAIETHVHADFVSGARELAAIGVRAIAGPGAGLSFAHHEVSHGERFALGDVVLTFLHTPGHTPEHIAVLVDEPGSPRRVLTGDTLFVDAVGRPDLLGGDLSRQLAGRLYETLHDVLLTLGDEVEVHPVHGAGSLCGAGIGAAPDSTIGRERHGNAFLQHGSRAAFVAAVLADLPETAPYFPRVKRLNHDGPDVLGLAEPKGAPPALSPAGARALVDAGALVIDLRSAEAFARSHATGALHLEAGAKVGSWGGWVLPATARLVLMAETERDTEDARLQLWRVGIDGVAGYLDGGFAAWRAAGLPVSSIARLGVGAVLRELRNGAPLTLVDVRSRREFERDHVEGALHIPLDELQGRSPGLPAGPVATICETGYRSSLAASLLARQGSSAVSTVAGGMTEYRMQLAPR